jgi:hypothetical protein
MAIIVDLGAGSPITTTHSGKDLVYYERQNLATPGNISLDWVVVDVCSDPLCITAYRVFNWGDNIVDANTSIGEAGYGSAGEPDNDLIPMTSPPLYGAPPPPLDPLTPNGSGIVAGIGIDVNPLYGVPDGTYQWVRIYSPLGGANDGAQVDALYVIP